MEVVIVAPVKVKPEYLEQFTQAMHVVLATSREEPGCLQYDVHREIDSANSFVFYERWRSDEAFAEHEASEHYKLFGQQIDGKLESIVISKFHQFA